MRDATQIASTCTTPGTALMAPAICGETLKRPGSFTSTSVPSAEQQHDADLAVALGLQPLARRGSSGAWIAQEDAQALLQLRGGLIERLGRLDAGADVVALRLGGEEQQHRRARLEQVAVLLQALPANSDRLVMPGRIGQAEDAHLVAGLGAPLRARHHGRGDAARARAGLHRAARTPPTTAPSASCSSRCVIVERMAGQEEADRVVFALQPVGRQPRLDRRERDASRDARARRTCRSARPWPPRACAAPSPASRRPRHARARGSARARRTRRRPPGFPARAC